jgi:hypothetical protein
MIRTDDLSAKNVRKQAGDNDDKDDQDKRAEIKSARLR